MPCYTPPHEQCNHKKKIDEDICELQGYLNSIQSRVNYYEEKSNKATRLLCAILSKPFTISLTPTEKKELDDWWDEHQEWDEKRNRGEKV